MIRENLKQEIRLFAEMLRQKTEEEGRLVSCGFFALRQWTKNIIYPVFFEAKIGTFLGPGITKLKLKVIWNELF